ncbi:hypothetical protein ACFQDF_26980 [Ectobacillus funiculus]
MNQLSRKDFRIMGNLKALLLNLIERVKFGWFGFFELQSTDKQKS